MSAEYNSVTSPYRIASAMAPLALCLAVAALPGGCCAPQSGMLSRDAFVHGGEGPSTMPALWGQPAAGEDALDKAAFGQAVGLVMNGQYPQASRQFSAILARLEIALAADTQVQPTTNPAQAPRQPSTAPASGASMATVRMAGECTFWIAYCAEKQGQIAQAAVLYNKVLVNYPGTPAASQAARRLNLLRLIAVTGQ